MFHDFMTSLLNGQKTLRPHGALLLNKSGGSREGDREVLFEGYPVQEEEQLEE